MAFKRLELPPPRVLLLVLSAFLGFLALEMFFWTSPYALRSFNMTPEFAAQTSVLAANQGLYNGFLAAGLLDPVAAAGDLPELVTRTRTERDLIEARQQVALRDAKIADIYKGTQQINQLIIARAVLGYSSAELN